MFPLDRSLHYDRQGRPMDMMTWAMKHQDDDYRIVAQHWVRGWKVSTVWIGLDYNFTFSGPPVIFETRIFAPKDVTAGREDWETGGAGPGPYRTWKYQERYATEDAAQAGHDRALAAMVEQLGGQAAAMDVMSAAQFSTPAEVPDDISGIEQAGG